MPELTRAIGDLLPKIRSLIASARDAAARSVNTLQVLTNFEIGRLIVEHEQEGAERAVYGKALIRELSHSLTDEFGRGFSHRNLDYMRRFYLTYRDREPQISQTVSAKLPQPPGERASTELGAAENAQASSASFTLSWSHYVFLVSIENPDERSFYEIEASAGGWTLAELKRQLNSGLYERLALSRDRDAIRDLAREGQIVAEPKDVLKNPYVLEFLGLEERPSYSESDLESAIIDKLEHFLLELGKGFLFEARQKRFTFDEEHFFVDLVFYNRLLRCYVLIDLKIGKLSHQDLGQMQMYVNYFDRHVKTADERPTVGIILCRKKHEALVEITLPEDSSIYASEYQLYLPSKEQLRQ
ncbi:MAG: DUF1016 domain-containing protein, partial [bacterium]|nr:DUF1016 domain-containing protein [bacterium]